MNRIFLSLFVLLLCLPVIQTRAEKVHEIKRKIRESMKRK